MELVIHLLQMLARVDVSTGVSRIDDDNSTSIVVCKSFDSLKNNLSTLLRKQIVVASLEIAASSRGFKQWESRPWKQNVGAGTGKNSQYDINSLSTPKCEINI